MKLLNRRVRWAIRDRALFLPAALGGRIHRHTFDDVRRFCLFVGYPRSGHTLIGSLLDAHPDAVIAHELGVMRYVRLGLGRNQLYYLLLAKARRFARKGSRWSGYSYRVPRQWQGKMRCPRVIGDKAGGATTRILGQQPELLDRLRDTAGVAVACVHVVRNPYDNITTRARNGNLVKREVGEKRLREKIDRHFREVDTMARLRPMLGDSLLELRHEDFVDDPRRTLARLCTFLHLDPDPDYLHDCASIVFRKPSATRSKIHWPDWAIRDVEERMNGYEFLEGYSFEER